MTGLKFLPVAVAAILFSQASWAYGNAPTDVNDSNSGQNTGPGGADAGGGGNEHPEDDGEDEGTVGEVDETATNKAERAECWEQMNLARTAAGFDKLTQQNMFKLSASDWANTRDQATKLTEYLGNVCNAMKTNTAPEGLTPVAGTVAYAVQEGEQADCQAAVDYWKEALTNFNGEVPPAYGANAAPYDNTQNVSFISLFNPQANPTVDCAYFVCPASTQNAKEQQGNTNTDKSMNALICVTSPSALTNSQEPFTKEQWNKITAALNSSSAASAAPAALALAAAAFAAVFL
ncbi:SAG family member [Eimeria mitis]|uniref:SAG family member n=1 Tax=Eimeria mitis TaxID=44415 RepID=U6KEJ3_9EIME|nr:SAG family member [Eimeria mitis]CDJ35226.1 SAG family member [Eimeria mitis]